MTSPLPKEWKCYLCHRVFVHARLLTGHLLDVHKEWR
jgi:hypothetical protein